MVLSEHEVILKSTIQQIWPLIVKLSEWPTWNPSLRKMQVAAAPQVGDAFEWGFQKRQFLSEIYTLKHQDRIAYTLKSSGIHGNMMIRITSVHHGVHVKLRAQLSGWKTIWFKKGSKKFADAMLQSFIQGLSRSVKAR